jgi:hypothetical protein
MRIFVHFLEGEARKWFRALPPGSIDGIEVFDNAFVTHYFGHSGDVSTSDVFRLPQGLFA